MENDLGIRPSPESMPFGEEFRSQFRVVVDLSIEDDPHCLVFISYRLATSREIDDAESAHTQADGSRHIIALVIGPPVVHGPIHPFELVAVQLRAGIKEKYSANSTHILGSVRGL
jgi:hypothetical protein